MASVSASLCGAYLHTADSLVPDSLSDDEIKLLNMFGGLSRKKQQMALGVMLTLTEIDC